jgi:hypothetical protein
MSRGHEALAVSNTYLDVTPTGLSCTWDIWQLNWATLQEKLEGSEKPSSRHFCLELVRAHNSLMVKS